MPTAAVLPPAVAAPPDWREALLTQRTATLSQLYRRTFPVVRQYVQQQGGTDQDAQDVFQDALVVFYEKMVAGTLTLTAEPGTYLAGVSRHLWQRERARRTRHPHLDLAEAPLETLAETDEPPLPAVRGYLAQLSEKCRGILLSFYYFGQPLTQVAATYGFNSVRSATVQKFKCLEHLRNAVRAATSTTA
ncbi:sigma-70 family RNA polymerase sigma factor [Hymenobacter sp. RP-2-7]|uniref:Sigma-70 family RNA polymerase sigma factor n=1 Tax=Hymenobacter polaris TaxID=2682546 RepID=A0A7Y0AE11_9BACT|nr:sigma-70 family RNA polymerase sigma factor [Hymenobacter polaris]NML65648.1 sigma-70 family RNA polymerase sigma factor [Hymenobacter polaris]